MKDLNKKVLVSKDIFNSDYRDTTKDGKKMERFTIQGYVSRSYCFPAVDKAKNPIMSSKGKPLHTVMLVIKDKDKNEHKISFLSGLKYHNYDPAVNETSRKYWVAQVSGEQFVSDKGNLIQFPREVSVMQIEKAQEKSKNRDALAEAFLKGGTAKDEPEVQEPPVPEEKEAPMEPAFDELPDVDEDVEEPAFDEADLDEDVLGRF